jgi:predicted polyphosphate/ATP-dependent NAD kinase
MYGKAVELGARPVSPVRTREFLAHLRDCGGIRWLSAPGPMGADYLREAGVDFETVGQLDAAPGPDDTRRIAVEIRKKHADLIVFAGGDGTARDMADAIGLSVPVVAVPAGVKVYSAVFAFNARAAALLVDAFVDGAEVGEEEVLDIDENAFRHGRVDSRHYGYLLVPEDERFLQAGKDASAGEMSAEARHELANAMIEEMRDGRLYLLGSGTTIKLVADELGLPKTLLGVDAVVDRQLVGSDLNESAILELLDQYPDAAIVVTPLGGNGFIFGRGNKQFSPEVLRRVGVDHVLVMAGRSKLMQLPELHVDTGDEALDVELSGFRDVLVGRGHRKLMRVR